MVCNRLGSKEIDSNKVTRYLSRVHRPENRRDSLYRVLGEVRLVRFVFVSSDETHKRLYNPFDVADCFAEIKIPLRQKCKLDSLNLRTAKATVLLILSI